MKHIILVSKLLKGLTLIGSFILIQQCTYGQISKVTEGEDKIIIGNRQGIEFVVIKKGFRYGFQKIIKRFIYQLIISNYLDYTIFKFRDSSCYIIFHLE